MKLNQRGITVTAKTIDFFIKKPAPINRDDMYFNHLSMIIKQFHLNKYGKEIASKEIIKNTILAIMRDFSHLSTVEIGYCTKRVIDGEDQVNDYVFNTSDLIKVIRRYNSKKKAVIDSYFMMAKDEKESRGDKAAKAEFLQDALSKMDKGDHLTIYEKSAIGKSRANLFKADELAVVNDMVEADLPALKKILNAKRSSFMSSLEVDPEMNTPIMWTEPLLFGVKLFNQLKPNYET